jgi:hypothetical protein
MQQASSRPASKLRGLVAVLWLAMLVALLAAPTARAFAVAPVCCADVHSDVPHRHAGSTSPSEVAGPTSGLATVALGLALGGAMPPTLLALPTSVDGDPPDHPPR